MQRQNKATFISFILIVKPRTLRKTNLITVLAKDPNGEKTRKEVNFVRCGRKT